jgi:hypothetical protein
MIDLGQWRRQSYVRGSAIESRRRARNRNAFCPVVEQLEPRTLLSAVAAIPIPLVAAPQWVSAGPAPIIDASSELPVSVPSAQDGGAVNALAVDPQNPEHVYAATVNGGIWQTKNYTAANPIWTTTTDHMPSLAISAIAISPVNDKIIYAGTGNYSSVGSSVFNPGLGDNAAGIYKSCDGGATWTVCNPKGIFDGLRIRRVVPTTLNGGLTVFAATTDTAVNSNGAVVGGGVYRSDDGGKTWTRLSGSADGLPNTGVTDLAANPNQFFAAIAGQAGGASPGYAPNPVTAGSSGIWRLDLSVPNPTWTNIASNAMSGAIANASRVELSISKAAQNPIWVTTIDSVDSKYDNFIYSGVFRAPDTPSSVWASIGAPDVLTSEEGDSKGCMLADPNDANILYVAGDTRYQSPYTGYVARYDYSTNTWTNITPDSAPFAEPGTVRPIQTGVTSGPHGDCRGMQIGVDGDLLLASDGGVYRSTDPTGTGTQVAWSSVNGSMADTEFYQVALDNQGNTNPADDLILGASQDNGGDERAPDGTWVERDVADGTAVAADPVSGTRYFSSDSYYLFTYTGPNSTIAYPPGTLTGTGGKYFYLNPAGSGSVPSSAKLQENPGFPFYIVLVLNQGDIDNGKPAQLLLAGNNGTLYLSSDQGNSFTSIGGLGGTDNTTPQPVPNIKGTIMAMAFGSAANENVAYVCTADGYISVTQNITAPNGGFDTRVRLPDGQVGEAVVIDPNHPMTAYVATQTEVFMTTNGGSSWTAITDNLGQLVNPFDPDPSVIDNSAVDSRSIALINTGTAAKPDDHILVGEPGGVFIRPVNPPAFLGSNTWRAFGAGTTLPNTLFTSLAYDSKSDALLAGTLGRGAWLLKHVRAAIHNSLFNFPVLTGIGDGQIPVVPAVSGLGAVPVTVNGTSPQVTGGITGQGTISGVGSESQIQVAGGVRLPRVELNRRNPSDVHGSAYALLFDSVADHLLFAHNGFDNLLTVG